MGQNLADTEIDAAAAVTDSATGWADKVIAVLNKFKSGTNPLGTAALRDVDTTEESNSGRKLMPLDSTGKAPVGHLRDAGKAQKGVVNAIRQADHAGTAPGDANTSDRVVSTDTSGRLPAKFLPAATASANGIVRLAAAGETTGNDVVTASAMAGVPVWTKVSAGDYWQIITTDDAGTAFNLSADIVESSNHFLALEVRYASEFVLPLITVPRDRINEVRPTDSSWDGNVLLFRENKATFVETQSPPPSETTEYSVTNTVTGVHLGMWMPTNRQLRVQATPDHEVRIRTIWRVSGIPM